MLSLSIVWSRVERVPRSLSLGVALSDIVPPGASEIHGLGLLRFPTSGFL